MSLDLLSFSPSLVHIFSLLHPKDVGNCQLVSRRLDDIIRRNRKQMRRWPATMKIYTFYPDRGQGWALYIVVVVDNSIPISIGVHPTRTQVRRWQYHKRSIIQHYAENDIGLAVSPMLDHPARALYQFLTDGLSHGLRFLIRYFFERYHFTDILFHESCFGGIAYSPEWCQIVCEEVARGRSSCDNLILKMWTGPNTHCLFTQLECDCIWIVNDWCVRSSMKEIPRWDKTLGITVSPQSFADFGIIVDFLTNWEDGTYPTVKSVLFYQKLEFGLLKWEASEIIEKLSCKACVAVKRREKNGDNEYFVEIYISRLLDNRILGLQYSRKARTLIVEEVGGYTGSDEQLRISNRRTFKPIKKMDLDM